MAQIQNYKNLVQEACEVVEFKLIRTRKDMENDALVFHPYMTHQIFGETETIFGYQDLRIRILYTAGPLHIYIGTEYSNKVDDLSNGDIKADDVVNMVAENLPDGCYFVNMDEFLKTLDKADKFKPFGEKIGEHVYRSQEEEKQEERTFEMYHCDYKTPAFLKFFGRLQTFILWFIDAASYVDVDDMQWSYFVVYEKLKNSNGEFQYATVGYATVYEYYAYPQHKRPRISQMLVLPPFQKMEIGSKLLEAVYKFYQNQKNVADITVESPSDDFQRMRNLVDARLCMNLKTFDKSVIKNGFNKDMVNEARDSFKLNSRQCRCIYEILRLYHTNLNDADEHKAYRLEIKKRLSASYHKQLADIKKLEKAKINTEWLRACLPEKKERLEQLQDDYDRIKENHLNVIKKLKC